MSLPEQISSIEQFHEKLFKEKGSEFIAQVYPIGSLAEADEKLELIKKKFFDASHHCYAYKLQNGLQKFSDDGEPSGTAGIRIMNAIDHYSLTNLLIVVIRYFGGTKLGVGPLGKAYYTSAINVLSETKKCSKILFEKIMVKTDFSFISHIYRIVESLNGKVEESEYNSIAVYQIMIKPKYLSRLTNQLSDISGGRIQINLTGESIYQ
jgi:uncharacterized YigZ family protein